MKNFKGKKIRVRPLGQKDIALAKGFRDYFNELIEEDAKILMKTKKTLEEQRQWLEEKFKAVKKHKRVCLLAESGSQIVGFVSLTLGQERQDHIAVLSVNVRQGWRGLGLGTYLIKQITRLAKKQLKPRPKIIQLQVFANNPLAIKLYQKLGFQKTGFMPKQLQYKNRLVGEYTMLLEI